MLSSHKRSYSKTFKSSEELADILSSRGLLINDRSQAVGFLSYVTYSRFFGYALVFRDSRSKKYRPDVSFEDVVAIYQFDRTLRSLIFDGIASIEVYFRTKITNFIGENYGPFGHMEIANFHSATLFENWRAQIRKEAKISVRTDKPFRASAIQHFQDVYTEWPNVPIWMLSEILSFGALKTLFSFLDNKAQTTIAREFGVKSRKILYSWLGLLNATRNVCAHFERLWNRTLQTAPIIPNDSEWNFIRQTPYKIFTVFTIIKYTLDVIAEKTSTSTDWKERFYAVMADKPRGTLDEVFYQNQMGLVANWETQEIWKR